MVARRFVKSSFLCSVMFFGGGPVGAGFKVCEPVVEFGLRICRDAGATLGALTVPRGS